MAPLKDELSEILKVNEKAVALQTLNSEAFHDILDSIEKKEKEQDKLKIK